MRECKKAVVQIAFRFTISNLKTGESFDDTGLGSGFIVSEDGYVLTAEHVIGEGKLGAMDSAKGTLVSLREIIVMTHDGKLLEATLPQPYPPNLGPDIGVLRIDKAANFPFLRLAEVDRLELGEDVVVLGYPDSELTVTQGMIITLAPTEETFRISAATSGGSSGSPVFNSDGEVVGVATFSGRHLRGDGEVEALFGVAANLALHRKAILDFIEQDRSEFQR